MKIIDPTAKSHWIAITLITIGMVAGYSLVISHQDTAMAVGQECPNCPSGNCENKDDCESGNCQEPCGCNKNRT